MKRKSVIYTWKNLAFPQCVKIGDVYVALNEGQNPVCCKLKGGIK